MIKQFELWLDESGNFEKQAELKGQDYMMPSLVGGMLIEKDIAKKINFDAILDTNLNHAMNFTNEEKKNYVIPILEQMDTLGGRQVFFENLQYKDAETSRQLYLNVLSEGLIQLLARLDAQFESVELNVIIAQRTDRGQFGGLQRISESEYVDSLKSLINKKLASRNLVFDKDTSLKFIIDIATVNQKLMIADFCCNTRLTRKSKAFVNSQDKLSKLYENALFFSLQEKPSITAINKMLIRNDIASAIIELYTTIDKIADSSRTQIIDEIINRLDNLSYASAKGQIAQCASEIHAYAQSQNDYLMLETVFTKIDNELLNKLKEAEIPCVDFEFQLLMDITEACIRSGDVIKARKLVDRLEKVQKSMGDALENMLSYHWVLEKKALLFIKEYDFESALVLMSKASEMYEKAIEILPTFPALSDRFSSMTSRHFGNIMCMQLYAMMFMQRSNKHMYEDMVKISEHAVTQYPRYEELERHLQYRSHIEMEAGNYKEALLYLFKSAQYDEEFITKNTVAGFINVVCNTRQTRDIRYYLMYYLLILSEAALAGDMELADLMYEAMDAHGSFMKYGDISRKDDDYTVVDTKMASTKASGKQFHPIEVIQWKYAAYLTKIGKAYMAEAMYKKAVNLAFSCETYVNMRITGLGILAEKICADILNEDIKTANEDYTALLKQCDAILSLDLQPKTRDFVELMKQKIVLAKSAGNAIDSLAIYGVSRMITY